MSEKTEIKLEFVGTAGINPFISGVSSPRAVMDFSHISSRVPLLYPDTTLIQTGIEYELGKYINDVKTEHDCVVKAVVPKYVTNDGTLSAETIMLVEYEKNNEIWLDMIEVPSHKSTHGFFGYRLHPTEEFQNLHYNAPLAKGTILASTDSLGEEGDYRYTVNANVAFMSHPSVAEDGFAVRDGFLDKIKFTAVTKRAINITKDTLLLNLNGDLTEFKFLPNVGELVREDGLLCATRPRDDWFSIVDTSNDNICELDSTFDTPVYVPKNSVVVDIKVTRGNYNKSEFTSVMTQQLDHYAELQINHYRNVVGQYERILNEKKMMYGDTTGIRQTGRLRRFIADCMIKINAANTGKMKLSYRKLPIDQYRIEVTVVSVIRPNLGFKLTDIYASKGVICRVLPDWMMPVDENGNVVDIIADSSSTISRMNVPRAYHHYLGAASRDNRNRLLDYLGKRYPETLPQWFNHAQEVYSKDSVPELPFKEKDIQYCIDYLRDFYSLINPDMVTFIDSLSRIEKHKHLEQVLLRQLNLHICTDNSINGVDIVDGVNNSPYAPHLGKLTYVDEYGKKVTTVDDIRVGNMSIMVLEKVAMDYSAAASARVNSFNFPIKGSNADKYKYPHNLTPTTTLSETEVRILSAFADPVMIAELMDLALNPISHKQLIKHILEADQAYSVDFDIDRELLDYGQTKSLIILRHIFNAAGFDIDYVHDDEEGVPF